MSNPYQSPGGYDARPQNFAPYKISRMGVDYPEAFQFAMANPNWIVNCLLIGIVNLIPIVGPMVTLGYLYDDYEALLRSGRPAPTEFKFEKFADYLQRGVMPFLAMLVAGLVIGMVISVILVPLFILSVIALKNNEEMGVVITLGIQMGGGLMGSVLGLLIAPVVLRVGISNKFEEITNFNWHFSMLKSIWPQIIVGAIVSAAAWMILAPIGMLMCCVGIIPVSAYYNYFYFHLQRQWYEIYVTKGGEPIPLPGTEGFVPPIAK